MIGQIAPVKFAAFTGTLSLTVGGANADKADFNGTATPGAKSNGTDCLSEEFAFRLRTSGATFLSATFPPHTLQQGPQPGACQGKATVSGVDYHIVINRNGNDLGINVTVTGAEFGNAVQNPIFVDARIGDDFGTAQVPTAAIK